MRPRSSGQGLFPRYGGGWMHQFGHVYALQQELLDPNANNWFRAVELWHTARQEGVAMNVSHFTSILRQCVQPGAWAQSLQVLRQMKRENIRPDVVGVGCALAACVEGRHYAAVEDIFATFHKSMLLDSVCHLALIRARQESGDMQGAIKAGRQQEAEQVPFLPYTYTHLLEACSIEDDADYAMELVRNMRSEQWAPSQRAVVAIERLGRRHEQLARAAAPLLLSAADDARRAADTLAPPQRSLPSVS
ncbi:Pentatricopeptide repeat domain containing protein [Novymonas esmeraldas]|uniref:Pentatricopeptide repeat domain containing protein n=1 Tax=Novymonas esmeraldas TaxID=1808958 RepID=A0AAW0EU20_9TRYP